MRASDLDIPFRGVRAPPLVEWTHAARCAAYCTRMPHGHYFSHVSAAVLWGIPLPRTQERGPLHVSAALPERGPRARGVVGHTPAHPEPVTSVDGIARTSPYWTWCQLAGVLDLDALVAAGDATLAFHGDDTTAALARTVRAFGRRRGAALAREALDLLRPRVDSPRETRLRLLLVRAGLPEPETNLDIRSATRGFVARCDLVYREFRIVVEYEGEVHESLARYDRDITRYNDLSALGWIAIRVTRKMSADEVVRRTRSALLSRGWLP